MGQLISQIDKRFVYGRFHWPGMERGRQPPLSWGSTAWDPVAIEILREYSASEFLGKLYVRGAGGSWTQAGMASIQDLEWHRWYLKLLKPVRTTGTAFYFEMEGSGRWKVLHFRTESDATGPYVAVALQHIG